MSEGLLSTDDTQAADLVRAIEQPFDAQNPDHVEASNRLWQAAWPEIPFAGLVHGGWTRLGFPSGDLVKELTSIASVHHLLKLATHAPALFASALEADCPLLAASSAVCLLLRDFLRLNTPGSVSGPIGGSPPPGRGSPHGRRVATDETRHRFLSWDESRSDAFDALQLEFTVYLLTTWFDHKLKTLMDFPKALVQTRERIEAMLPRIEAGSTYQIRAAATS